MHKQLLSDERALPRHKHVDKLPVYVPMAMQTSLHQVAIVIYDKLSVGIL